MPCWHGGQEFSRIAIRIPNFGINISPLLASFRIQVVEIGLHHPAVHKQAFDLLSVPNSALIRGLAVNPELVAMDGNARLARFEWSGCEFICNKAQRSKYERGSNQQRFKHFCVSSPRRGFRSECRVDLTW